MTTASSSYNRLRLGVLMGGKSIESEVSFNSGRTVCDHLDTHLYDVTPIFQTHAGELYILPWHFLHRGKIADFELRLATEAEKISWDELADRIDFAYLAQHGRFGEDGVLQGTLEVLGIPYLGAKIFGSALGMDKAKQKIWLKGHGFDVPRGFVVAVYDACYEDVMHEAVAKNNLVFPLIVKPAHEGSSRGVAVVHTMTELLAAVLYARTITPGIMQQVLVEEYVQGREFSCIVLQRNNRWEALSVTEIHKEQATFLYDYQQKYMPGRARKYTPARFDKKHFVEIMHLCERISEHMCFRTLSRIDGIYADDGRIVVIDPNSLAGMSPTTFIFDQAAQHSLTHTQLIHQLIVAECSAYGLPFGMWQQHALERKIAMPSTRTRIMVLFGGDSNEREVSLESGRNVCYKLSAERYEVIPVFVQDDMRLFRVSPSILIKNSTKDIVEALASDSEIKWADIPQLADFVFIGLHGGKGENGAVQGMIEMLGLAYNGPGVFASSLCMDKFKTNTFLRMQGINVPEGALISLTAWQACDPAQREAWLLERLGTITFPCIIKPHDDGCSVLVSKANSLADMNRALSEHVQSGKQFVLCEEFVRGMELTVGVLGNEHPHALPPSYSVAAQGVLSMEEKFLPGAGENQTPAPLDALAQQLVADEVVRAFKAAGCAGYSRIDCFYQTADQSPTGESRVVILEINTLPALTPATCLFHQAAEIGLRPMDLIDEIIRLGIERHTSSKAFATKDLQERSSLSA